MLHQERPSAKCCHEACARKPQHLTQHIPSHLPQSTGNTGRTEVNTSVPGTSTHTRSFPKTCFPFFSGVIQFRRDWHIVHQSQRNQIATRKRRFTGQTNHSVTLVTRILHHVLEEHIAQSGRGVEHDCAPGSWQKWETIPLSA